MTVRNPVKIHPTVGKIFLTGPILPNNVTIPLSTKADLNHWCVKYYSGYIGSDFDLRNGQILSLWGYFQSPFNKKLNKIYNTVSHVSVNEFPLLNSVFAAMMK